MSKDWERKLKRELQNEAQKEFAGWSERDFINHILELRETIAHLKEQDVENEKRSPEIAEKAPLNESQFKVEWSYPTKIHFLLDLAQKPLTSQDLHVALLRLDSHYKNYHYAKNNLSVHLGRATRSGRIRKIKLPGIKMKYFALPEWHDQNFNIDLYN